MSSDQTLLDKLKRFLLDTGGDELLDAFEDSLDTIITTVQSCNSSANTRHELVLSFECDDEDFPLNELECQVLHSLIHDHDRRHLTQLLQPINTTKSTNNNNNTTPTTTQHDSTSTIPSPPPPAADYNAYQEITHSMESEKRKQDVLASESNQEKQLALAKALGGQNGQYSDEALPDAVKALSTSSNDIVAHRYKQALKPKTAKEIVFGTTTTQELLQNELAPITVIDMEHLEQNLQQKQIDIEPKKVINNNSIKQELPSSTTTDPTGRDRNRNYTDTHNPYLNTSPPVTESTPIMYKVYKATVDVVERNQYTLTLNDFPTLKDKIKVILDQTQATQAYGQDESRRGLSEKTTIWVKILSDYYSVYKSEAAKLQEHHDRLIKTIGNDIEQLKKIKSREPQIYLSASMKEVDQATGIDLNPISTTTTIKQQIGIKQEASQLSNSLSTSSTTANHPQSNPTQMIKKKQSFSGIDQQALVRVQEAGKTKHTSEHDKWVQSRIRDGLSNTVQGYQRDMKNRQLKMMVDNDDDEDKINAMGRNTDPYMIELSDDEDHVDIDLTDIEPGFLKGFHSNLQTLTQESLDAIKLTQNEEGSLTAAARKQAENVKDRRQLKLDRVRDAVAHEMAAQSGQDHTNKMWSDPLLLAQEQSKYGTSDITRPLFAQQTQAAVQKRLLAEKSAALGLGGPGMGKDGKPQQVISYGRQTSATIKEQRESLPFYKLRENFLEMISTTQIAIVVGETGSGKTTQMAQYLLESGYGRFGVIGCTQPRRVAATSVAQRVAEEVGCELGTVVGYSVRFDERTSPQTRIRYMTDGMLLREILIDPLLTRYSVMIIDEAHERGVNTDVLLALIKAACKNRPDLKFIVTSATLDSTKFSTYFDTCPIFTIPGRTFPVNIHYSNSPVDDYFEAAMRQILTIHIEKEKGDILVFLTGEEEINDAVDLLTDHVEQLRQKSPAVPPLDVYPIFSSLPSEIQSRIFDPTPEGRRKCVVATNIAEASVTIDGIVYVVDTGVCKVSVYDPKQGIESLQVTPISQAQARQRAGRAGRTREGDCFRLYTEESFTNEMTPTTVPELQRCDLTSVILLLKALGINDLLGFDFIDPPATSSMLLALRQLFWLNAIDDDGLLTPVGARLAMLPIAPNLGKMLLVAADLGCVHEIAIVVALVSGDELWLRPKSEIDNADRAKAQLSIKDSDHATLVNVFMKWEKEGRNKDWCKRHYVATRALETAYNVKMQLLRTLTNMKIELTSCGRNWGLISRAVTAGLFMNAAKLERQEDKDAAKGILKENKTIDVYKTLTYGNTAPIHPSSSMANNKPEFIVYQKMLFTTKEWLHTCTTIHPQWLLQLAPHLYAEKSELLGSGGTKHNKTRLTELTDTRNVKGAWRLENRQG